MLANANQRWHQVLDALYQTFLESLTALEFDRARQHWEAFGHNLITHIDFEQTHIEPLTEAWENNTLKLIQSDHLILNRLLPRLDKAFGLIEQAGSPRTELVRQLDGFIKMRNVLEHHDLRETENLYPLLDEKIDRSQAEELADGMDAARAALGS